MGAKPKKSRKCKSLKERFEAKVRKTSGCWWWTGGSFDDGYGGIQEGRRGSCMLRAHRVSWELYRGEIPTGMQVLHHCDNSLCVNPEHLFLGTNADNVKDKVAKGRQARGSRISELVEKQVLEIRRRYNQGGCTQQELAEKYDVRQNTISRIVNRKSWTHV